MAVLYIIFLTSKAAIFVSFLYKITYNIRCKMMGTLFFLIVACSMVEFYKRVFHAFLAFFVMDCASSLNLLVAKYNDLGCGFLVFSRIFHVVVLLLLIIVLGLKWVQFKFFASKMGDHIHGGGYDDGVGVKKVSFECKCGTTLCCGDHKMRVIKESEGEGGFEGEWCDEDKVFDVMALRKMVKVERRRREGVFGELEKERMAASSAVDEAMAMILRLQNEKSALQIRVNQVERVAEEKQLHDHEVIQSLQWMVMRHESERGLLEEQLRVCREKLRVFMKGDEWDEFDSVCSTPIASQCSFGSRDGDVLVGSLDLDSSPL